MRYYSSRNGQPLSGPIYCPSCGTAIGLDDLHSCQYILPAALLIPDLNTRVVEFTKDKSITYTAARAFKTMYQQSNIINAKICNSGQTHLRCFYPKGTCQCPCWFCRTQERET